MKKFIVAASAIAMLSATPAFAQSGQGEILLSAEVQKACGVGNHISGSAASGAWDQSDIVVTLADTNGQFSGQTFTNRSWGNVWCNSPANVTISVGALTTPTALFDPGSFTNRFDVRVVTDAGVYVGQGQDYVISTVNEASGIKSVTGPTLPGAFETGLERFGGADSIQILPAVRPAGGNFRPVAGNYTGYVRFTATAN